jgi:predicted Rossmann fold flavoprotein
VVRRGRIVKRGLWVSGSVTRRDFDVAIIGAGAAGLMCALTAGRRGRRTLVVDHAAKLAEKIRISGGGRCNFTNLHTAPDAFLSANPHFCKSALQQFTPADFIDMVRAHAIAFHEKKLGQLFCDGSAHAIIDMLQAECRAADADIRLHTAVDSVAKTDDGFLIATAAGDITAKSLVVATGGLSIPKVGATGFGYDIARQFGLAIVPPRPGLVPLTFDDDVLARCKALTGLSVEAKVGYGRTSFAEGLLFTHRGLSGPSILQISSYWEAGEMIMVDLLPGLDASDRLLADKVAKPKADVATCLSGLLPKRLAAAVCDMAGLAGRIADRPDRQLRDLGALVNQWQLVPAGSEGYRTAEVTVGGVDTAALSSKTMQARHVPGLFFIGEVVDVTGHLGGYNFQWAWSSGFVAGQHA